MVKEKSPEKKQTNKKTFLKMIFFPKKTEPIKWRE